MERRNKTESQKDDVTAKEDVEVEEEDVEEDVEGVESESESESESEEALGQLIETNHLDLVNSIDLQRQLLFSYMRSKSILDEEDCERILNTGTTRQQKASIFLDVVKRKGKRGMKHFIDALQFEHPDLYTKITGKEPAIPESTIPYPTMSSTGELSGKDYIDFDRMVLAKQLDKTVGDFHLVTRFHHKVQEEKNILEKKLIESEKNAKIQQQYVEELKSAIEKFSEIKRLSNEDSLATHEKQSQFQRDIAIQQAVISKTYHIMALQGKLLALTEDLEFFRKENNDLLDKNEKLNKQMTDIAIRFAAEKRQSRRLNEQVLNHSETCKYEKQDLREVKLKLAFVKEDNDRLRKDLADLTKLSEMLNVKFKLMSHEKKKLKEQSEDVTISFQDAKDQVHELSCKFNSIQVDKKYFQQRNERLLADNSRHREMQKTYLDELELVRTECEKAWNSMEEARSEAMVVKKNHDEAMHSQLIIHRQLEERYDDVVEQLDAMRNCLEQTKEELINSQKKNRRLKTALQNTTPTALCDDSEVGEGPEKTQLENTSPVKEESFRLSRRARKDLLDSLKRKVFQKDNAYDMTPGGETAPNDSSTKSLSRLSFEQMRLMFPAGCDGGGAGDDKPCPGSFQSLPASSRRTSAMCSPRPRSMDFNASINFLSTGDLLNIKDTPLMGNSAPASALAVCQNVMNRTLETSERGGMEVNPSLGPCSDSSKPTAVKRLYTNQSPRFVKQFSLPTPGDSTGDTGSTILLSQLSLQERRSTNMEKLKQQKRLSHDDGDFLSESFPSGNSPFFFPPSDIKPSSVDDKDDNSSIFSDSSTTSTMNLGHVYLANTIRESPQMDFPPSKIHSTRLSPTCRKFRGKSRSSSTPLPVRGFSSSFFVYSDDCSETENEDADNFRERSSNHVCAGEKSKWSERRRSISFPTVEYAFGEKMQPFCI